MNELTEKIKKYAIDEAGFDLIGIARAGLPELHERAIEKWVSKGHAGSMTYMERDAARRARPNASLPSAKTVISLAINYFHPEDPKPAHAAGKVARYAYGRDYHAVIEKKLKKLAKFIKEVSADAETRVYVDTGPVLEKAFAKESGLGFFGKNTNIITREYGSWVFLASILTNLELAADEPHTGACGSCRICIDACPTEALLGNYEMDARRCISYLTIEARDERPAELAGKTGGWAFGCDICQEVCPYNFRAKTTRHADLYPNRIAGSWIDLEHIQKMENQEEYAAAFQGSPVRRPKLAGMKRNAAALLASWTLFFAAAASADTVYLKNGRKMEGIVKTESEKSIELEVGFGSVKLSRSEIKSIERTGENDAQRLERKWNKERLERFEAERKRKDGPKEITAIDRNGHFLLETRINGRVQALLILDTGASTILLSRKKAEEAKINLSAKPIEVKIADGRMVRAIPVLLDIVELGDVRAERVEATVLMEETVNPDLDGLLGMSFLNRFKFQVDHDGKKLILEKRR